MLDQLHLSDEIGDFDQVFFRVAAGEHHMRHVRLFFLQEANHFGDVCQFYTLGEGFTWETQDRARDVAMAEKAWEKAKELIRDERNSMVLLDEINIALRYDYIDVAEVVRFLKEEKPHMTHVVLTGRNAKEDLIEIADLVTEMELIKHPFRSGIKAQQGVEF